MMVAVEVGVVDDGQRLDRDVAAERQRGCVHSVGEMRVHADDVQRERLALFARSRRNAGESKESSPDGVTVKPSSRPATSPPVVAVTVRGPAVAFAVTAT